MKKVLNNLGFRFVVAISIGLFIAQSMFARERQGGIVQISMKDGKTIAGELIAVRENSLLTRAKTMEFSNTAFDEIKSLIIPGEPRVIGGAVAGFLGGGMLVLSLVEVLMPHQHIYDALRKARIGAFAGLIVGGIVGAAAPPDVELVREEHWLMSEADALKKLKAQALVPDAD